MGRNTNNNSQKSKYKWPISIEKGSISYKPANGKNMKFHFTSPPNYVSGNREYPQEPMANTHC